jgi:hypothetical protein
MPSFLGRRPSPAMLVALLALVVAMTGTATAAVLISSPDQLADRVITNTKLTDNAVDNRALSAGAVSNPKLATRSVDERTLASGAVGNYSLQDGAVSASKLAPGAAGGPTKAFGRYKDQRVPATSNNDLLTLDLPAGKYMIVGKLNVIQNWTNPFTCSLVAGSDLDETTLTRPAVSGEQFTARETVNLTVLHSSTSAFTARLRCNALSYFSVGAEAEDMKLTALQLDELQNTAG